MTTPTPRYVVEPYLYPGSTEPAYWYVWDTKHKAMLGGRHQTPESAQADADERNERTGGQR